MMNGVRQRLLHTLRGGSPSETLRRKALELEKKRKMRKSKSKDQFIVPVPESLSYLDTATMPMIVVAVGVVFFAKFLMMVTPHPHRHLCFINFIILHITCSIILQSDLSSN